jgi:DNA topoisomerase-3
LVGINASRALSTATGDNNYSLGRVQTPTLAMICSRYLENRNFKPVPYWVFKAAIEKDGITFHLTAKEKLYDKAQAEALYKKISENDTFRITSIAQNEVAQEPPLLYDLSALQQDANKRHGFSAEQTLNIAQKLYEAKLISYPRTGSRYISEDIFDEIPKLIKSLATFNRRSVNDKKVSDHHAIIITETLPEKLAKDEQIIYDMIAGRMLEAFSPKSVKNVSVIKAENGSGLLFEIKGSTIIETGWRGVFNIEDEKQEGEETKGQLPQLSEGEELTSIGSSMAEKQTTPKPLHTEASLLSAMENAGKKSENETTGIGTPATRAAIIETLFKRNYIDRNNKNLIPTEKGLQLYDAVKNLQIADANLTVEWEKKLKKIEEDPAFREVFSEEIREYTHKVVNEIASAELPINALNLTCPKCKIGKVKIFGKVAKCTDGKCNFVIFKTICGKTLTEKQITDLINKKRTGLLKGFKSNQGNIFDAALKFDENHKVAFEFKNSKK